MNAEPQVHYAAAADGCHLAYLKMGRGPALIDVPHFQMSHLRLEWRIEAVREWCETLARRQQVVKFDNHGGGLSDRECDDFSLETLAEDIGVVADAAGLTTFALFGRITGALPAIAFAAAHPECVTHLILWNGFARDADHGQNERMQSLFRMAATDWEMFTESVSQAATGWEDADAARQWATVLRAAGSQATFLTYLEARRAWDVSELLERIKAPTLVLVDASNRLANEKNGRELASRIPGAAMQTVDSKAGVPGTAGIAVMEEFLGVAGQQVPAIEGLTNREAEVLGVLGTGASNAAIAERLSISINTVTRHLTHIYAKTGCANRAEAMLLAVGGRHRASD